MLPSRSLRWAGRGIDSTRQRLLTKPASSRHFSINTSTTLRPRSTRLSQSSRQSLVQQSRSLSLFGWGGSSKPSSDTVSSPSSPPNIEIGSSTPALDNVRSIKASHATSDAPDPTQTHHHSPNNIEPEFIERLQENITLPHGAASEKVGAILSGETDITAASERMGYLKEVCGLDFGWGPSAVMETLLEYLHVSAGLSWTASIVAVAAILRLVMVKPLIDSQVQGKKMREMQPYTKPLREKYMEAQRSGDRAKSMELGAQMRELNKSAGISYTKAFVPLLIQLPFSFGAFRVLRNAGQLPVPAFVTEEWLWTKDLSFSDPYYIVPAISAITIWFSFRLQQKSSGPNPMFGPEMMKVFGNVLPAFSFAFMAFQPGSVQLYFMTTGLFAYATTAIMRVQWFRNITNLGPLPNADPSISSPSAIPSPSKPIAKKLPSNIQLLEPAYTAPSSVVEEAPLPAANRSIIDRAVDKAKGSWKSATDGVKTAGFTKKVEDKQRENREAAARRYEANRQRELEREREERNKRARNK